MRILLACGLLMLMAGCDMYKRSSFWSQNKSANQQKDMQAVLKNKAGDAAFIARIDLKGQKIKIRRVTNAPAENKSYELWAIHPKRKNPYSLGVLDNRTEVPASGLGKLEASWLENTTLAISLEPSGGSPTGKVTGPVLFTGKVKAAGV